MSWDINLYSSSPCQSNLDEPTGPDDPGLGCDGLAIYKKSTIYGQDLIVGFHAVNSD